MKKNSDLEILPANFRHEKEFLQNNNLDTWEIILNLSDQKIRHLLQKKSLCTESRIKKIRAIALFVNELNLTPHQAYLLLHVGIGSLRTLSTLNPHSLKQRIGRLERRMGVRTQQDIDQNLLKNWIKRAKDLI